MKVEKLVERVAEFAATGPVLKRLIDLKLLVWFKEYTDNNRSVDGYLVNPIAFCIMLNADRRFKRDVWNFLHPEIKDPVGFREYKIDGRPGSAQIIVGEKDGRKDYCHVDIDRHNTQDLVNIVAHIFGDVLFKPRGKDEPSNRAGVEVTAASGPDVHSGLPCSEGDDEPGRRG